MKSFINLVRKDVADDPSMQDNYCVIVHVFTGYSHSPTSKAVKYVYKNIDEFEKKFPEDVNKIDTSLGVDFQAWKFD